MVIEVGNDLKSIFAFFVFVFCVFYLGGLGDGFGAPGGGCLVSVGVMALWLCHYSSFP